MEEEILSKNTLSTNSIKKMQFNLSDTTGLKNDKEPKGKTDHKDHGSKKSLLKKVGHRRSL